MVVVEDGTSLAGAIAMRLPEGCTYICAGEVWGSIGYATGALLGTLAAAPDRRHILFTGDGSLQLTVQEISTMLRHGYTPQIFLINNRGYTIERTIMGKNDAYNDIANRHETLMEKDDAPEGLIRNGHELATQDFGPRGPQNEPGAQIQLPATQVAVPVG